jgi:hypothetical protein
MMFKKAFFAVATASTVLAQRPTSTSICDYYTTALLKDNTDVNQLTLLTLLVNTVVIGNCKFGFSLSCGEDYHSRMIF